MWEEYKARINKVMDYIEAHIDRDFTLEELADQACFSKFHFHRVFHALIGETLFNFIQRIRLEKAAVLMQYDPQRAITDIALSCGFNSSAAFARSFKKHFGLSATQWRKEIISKKSDHSNLGKLISNQRKDHKSNFNYIDYNNTILDLEAPGDMQAHQVKIKDLADKTVAYIRYIGPYQSDSKVFERLYAKLFKWAGPRELIDEKKTEMLNLYHDDTEITEKRKLRLSACITIPEDISVEGEINKMIVSGGKYACAAFILSEKQYQEAWDWMCKVWLPTSGYVPDDRLSFELYSMNTIFDTPNKNQHNVEICIPVKPMGS